MSTKQQNKEKDRHDNGLFDLGAGQNLVNADKFDPNKFQGTQTEKDKEMKKSRLRVAQRASLDADCLVTAMILGLCRERVARKREIILTAEYEKQSDLVALKDATGRINKALATMGFSHLPEVKCGYSQKHYTDSERTEITDRLNETPEETEARKKKEKEARQKILATETPEEKKAREKKEKEEKERQKQEDGARAPYYVKGANHYNEKKNDNEKGKKKNLELIQRNYITGKRHGAGLAQSTLKDFVNLDQKTSSETLDVDKNTDLYVGRGAYTGIHVVNGKTVFWGSTFRHKIPRGYGRWIPDGRFADIDKGEPNQTLTPWGLIGNAPHLARMQEAPKARSDAKNEGSEATEVVGYTHGMVQAIYSAAFHGFKGTTIEVAVGKATTKLASCFACTTFMCATDYPPDAIHLGRGESWAPVIPEGESFEILAERFQLDAKARERLKSSVRHMNKKWEEKCASWLYWGSRIDLSCVNPEHRAAWKRVQKFAQENRNRDDRTARRFLDALTVHCSDTERVNHTLVE